MTAFHERGAVAPKALGGWRHRRLYPRRVFILRRVAEKDDISMPELAGGFRRKRRESRSRLALPLADPQRP